MEYQPPKELRCFDTGIPQFIYVPDFLEPELADRLFAAACRYRWRSECFPMFGRQVQAPRRVTWFGDEGACYRYSGVSRMARPWPKSAAALRRKVEAATGARFNFALVNRYRDGNDTVGWHADNESDLGFEPVVAAVSLGSERVFQVKPCGGGSSMSLRPAHGSLILMWGRFQNDYRHQLPRTKRAVGERVSFSFRSTHRVEHPAK